MPEVSITLDIGGSESDMAKDKEYQFYVYNSANPNEEKSGFKLDRPPKEIEYSGFANTYNEAARPDRKPLLRRSGRGLRKINMTFILHYQDIEDGIDDRLKKLKTLAEQENSLIIEYGGDKRVAGDWSITNYSFRSIERRKKDDEISRAEVTLEFTEVPSPTPVALDRYRPRERPKIYTTKKGDTLLKIVKRYYGTDHAKIVRAIAKINKIENIKHPMKAGRKIRLP